MVRQILARGLKFSVENPSSSRLWSFKPIQDFIKDPRCILVVFDCCMHGAHHKKSTAILTNLTSLSALAKRCDGKHRHDQLRGTWRVFRDGKWKTENKTTSAGAYTWELCHRWAELALKEAPAGAFEDLTNEDAELVHKLRTAKRRTRLGSLGSTSANQDFFVSELAAKDAINSGVVFGQHTKEEASRLGGPDFQHGYPKADF